MVDYEIIRTLWKIKKIELLPLVLTFVACLGLNLEYGIIIGVGVSLLMLLYPTARPKIQTLQTDVLVLSLTQGFTFPSCDFILEEMENLTEKDGKHQSCVLDCSHISVIDFSALHCMQELILEFKMRDTRIVFAGIPEKVYSSVVKADIKDLLCTPTIQEAVALLQEQQKKELQNGNHLSNGFGDVTIVVNGTHHPEATNTEDMTSRL